MLCQGDLVVMALALAKVGVHPQNAWRPKRVYIQKKVFLVVKKYEEGKISVQNQNHEVLVIWCHHLGCFYGENPSKGG